MTRDPRPKLRIWQSVARHGLDIVRIDVVGDDRALAMFDEPDSPDALRDEGWPLLDFLPGSAYDLPRDRLE